MREFGVESSCSVDVERLVPIACGAWVVLRKARERSLRDIDTLIAGLSIESGLPLLTGWPQSYWGIRSLIMVPAKDARDLANTELFGA